MALHCHIVLVLLASIISQCGAIEYYVKPTDFTNVTCPGQPCLTINEYTNASAYYIKSNTVFTFLPGKHIAVRPVVIRDVENISLTAIHGESDANIATQFLCQHSNSCAHDLVDHYGDACCSVITLINVADVSIKGMSIEVKSYEINGITIQKSRNVHIQMNISGLQISNSFCTCGVLAFESSRLFVDRMQASHHSSGLVLLRTNDTTISNSMFSNNTKYGVDIMNTDSISLLNTTIVDNHFGMSLHGGRNTTMEKVNFIRNGGYIPNLNESFNTHITDMYDSDNLVGFMLMSGCNNTQIRNMFAYSNKNFIEIARCTNVSVINVVNVPGFAISHSKNIHLKNVIINSTYYNRGYGLFIELCNNITMTCMYVYSNNSNNQKGIEIVSSNDTTILHSSLTSEGIGISAIACRNTILVNISTANSQKEGREVIATVGILMEVCNTVSLTNISLAPFRRAGLDFYKCSKVLLEHSLFSGNYPITTQKYSEQSAIVSLKETSILLSDCVFIKNNITSIQAASSNITLHGNLLFFNNRALYGAVFAFSRSSKLTVSPYCVASFHDNFAIDYGGVFYVVTEEILSRSMSMSDMLSRSVFGSELIYRTKCFFHAEGERSTDRRLFFAHNRAGKGGDVVFGGLVRLGWDGRANCLESFKTISDFSGQSEASLISSAPSRVCLCQDKKHDCLIVADPTTYTIYPGESISIPAVTVGQDFGTVTGSVVAQILIHSGSSATSAIDLSEGQRNVLINKGPCENLTYTFYTNCIDCTAVLVLQTDNAEVLSIMTTEDNHRLKHTWKWKNLHLPEERHMIHNYVKDFKSRITSITDDAVDNFLTLFNNNLVFRKEIYHYPLYVNVSFRSCPHGFSLTPLKPFKCDCSDLLKQMPGVVCTIQDQSISRAGSVWVGIYGNQSLAASQYCPLNYCTRNEVNLTLMDINSTQRSLIGTDIQCNYNHSGILCGGCQPGLSLPFGGERCLKCSSYYMFLLLPYAMAGIILVLFIKVLNLTISEGTLNGLIFYANVIKANRYLYYSQTSVNPMTLFIAWLNLDLGIESCFVNGLTAYGRTWLQFVFPLYIWGIASLIIILAKYSNRMAKVMGNNGVPVLATLFLLSYAKLFNTILTALSYTTLYTTEGQKLVWSADGNIVYLGREHAPLFAVALATLLFLWLPYTLLLLVGQWLHRFNFRVVTRFLMMLKPLLDAHYASFKPRHHYWFGNLLIVRAAVLLTSAVIPSDNVRIVVFLIAMCSIVLTFLGQNVYRKISVFSFSISFFMNLALLNLTKLFANDTNSEVSFNILTGISLLQFTGLVVYKLVSIAKHNKRVTALFISKCQREAAEDDIELTEMAAAERETESDSDEEQN